MVHTPSAVFHYSDAGGGQSGHIHHNKVNAIFQAAKKDLQRLIQLQVLHGSLWVSVHTLTLAPERDTMCRLLFQSSINT